MNGGHQSTIGPPPGPHRAQRQAQEKPLFARGRARMRLPVTAKIALQMAGNTGGSAGSPSPVGEFAVCRKCTSISGGAWTNRVGG